MYIQGQSLYIKANGECSLKHHVNGLHSSRGQSEILGNRWEFLRDGSRIWGSVLYVATVRLHAVYNTKVSYTVNQVATMHVCSFVFI